jgi:hypothetical protein
MQWKCFRANIHDLCQKLSEVVRMGQRIVVDKGMQFRPQEEVVLEVVNNPELD